MSIFTIRLVSFVVVVVVLISCGDLDLHKISQLHRKINCLFHRIVSTRFNGANCQKRWSLEYQIYPNTVFHSSEIAKLYDLVSRSR